MTSALFNGTTRRLGGVFDMLMRLQSQAESYGSPTLDPRALSPHMRRDLGLAEGEFRQLEPQGFAREAVDGTAREWNRLLMTPHAS